MENMVELQSGEVSQGLNIYFGVIAHKINKVAFEKKAIMVGPDCYIESY